MAVKMKTVYELLGASNRPASHAEKIVSATGGFLAILGIMVVSNWAVGSYAAAIRPLYIESGHLPLT